MGRNKSVITYHLTESCMVPEARQSLDIHSNSRSLISVTMLL